MFPSRSFPPEFLHSLFELIKEDEVAAWSVFLVCKKWRQAAFDCLPLWTQRVYLNNNSSVLYGRVYPRINGRRIENLILCASTPIIRSLADLISPRSPIIDPEYSKKLVCAIPRFLSFARNLKLEVPSRSWFTSLDNLFENSISHLEGFELSRFHIRGITDTLELPRYTCATLNKALGGAKEPWNLRCLRLRGCYLDLQPAKVALQNLEELALVNIPTIAAYTPLAIISILRNLPQLKRLEVTCATRWRLGSLERFGRPLRMNNLQSLSIATAVDSCAFLYTSLSLPTTCRVQIIIINSASSDVTRKSDVNFVERHLISIAKHHRANGGSQSSRLARLQVGSAASGLHFIDPDGSISLFLFLCVGGSNTSNLDRFTLLKLFRQVLRSAIMPIVQELYMDVDLDLPDPQDLSRIYPNQLTITRVEFHHQLSKITMKHPSGKLVFERPRNGLGRSIAA